MPLQPNSMRILTRLSEIVIPLIKEILNSHVLHKNFNNITLKLLHNQILIKKPLAHITNLLKFQNLSLLQHQMPKLKRRNLKNLILLIIPFL